MKKIQLILAFLFGIILFSCGPSEEELKRQQEIEDSIAKIERSEALDKASQLLELVDSLAADSLAADSLAKDSIATDSLEIVDSINTIN